jgi:5-methylcytosine-specific restriction endonuclease McrA
MEHMRYNKYLERRKKEIIVERGNKCEKCSKHVSEGAKLTIDHIIPVSILNQMGIIGNETFQEENFNVLCTICNNLKGEKLDFSNPKTKELLLKYLNEL